MSISHDSINLTAKPEHIIELEKEILTLTPDEVVEVAKFVSALKDGEVNEK